MVKCPFCRNEVTRVWRNIELDTGYQRIRKCPKCNRKFKTLEQYTGVALAKIHPNIKKASPHKTITPYKDNSTT